MLRSACKFVRRHRRTLVVGSLAGLGVYGYYQVKSWWAEAKEMSVKLRQEAKEQRRYELYLTRASRECTTAILNFLPTLKKRLFGVVDVNGPVRELKIRRAAISNREATGAENEGDEEGAAMDIPEFDLWEKVKVSGLTRLMVALYSFTSLNLMLRLQLHILGRRSFDESLEVMRALSAEEGEEAAEPKEGSTTLSMEARHNLLAKTYEYLLGDGLLALATDVDDAVSKVFVKWHCQHRLEVGSDEFVKMLGKVRRKIEGHVMEGAQMPLLKYIIRPDDLMEMKPGHKVAGHEESKGANEHERDEHQGEEHSQKEAGPCEDEHRHGGGHYESSSSSSASNESLHMSQAMLNETWDAVESPNFSFAMQDSLDAVFARMCEEMRKHIFPPVIFQTVPESADEEEDREGEGGEGDDEDRSEKDHSAERSSSNRFEQLPEKRPTLATLVSQLKGIIADLLEPSDANGYISVIAEQVAIEEFCLSVFSRERDQPK